MSLFKRRNRMLTKEEVQKLTADEKAQLVALLQEETVVEELEQPQKVEDTQTEVVDTVVVEETVVEEAIVEEQPVVEEPVKEEKPVVNYDLKFEEIEKRFDEKLKGISEVLLAKDKVITDLQSEIKELKRTSPFGGANPKPSETKANEEQAKRDAVVNGLRHSRSTQQVSMK